jgi:hypothetical protein
MPVRVRSLLVWILIQLGALALAVSGKGLWAHHPVPRESLAVQEMLVIQIAGMGMLFPILLANFLTMIAAVVLVWPFLQFAGILSGTAETQIIYASLYVSVWIAGLWLCRDLKFGIVFAELFTLGGAIFWYLYLESGAGNMIPAEVFGPLVGGVQLINGSGKLWIAWAEMGVPILVGTAWRAFSTHRGSSQTIPGRAG